MKSYTDLKQSKKLAEILSLESADMGWNVFVDDSIRCLPINDWDLSKNGEGGAEFIPCWSLASLLDALPDKIYLNNETYHLNYDKNEVKYLGHMTWDGQKCITSKANNIIDSCYEMIIKLYEQKLL